MSLDLEIVGSVVMTVNSKHFYCLPYMYLVPNNVFNFLAYYNNDVKLCNKAILQF